MASAPAGEICSRPFVLSLNLEAECVFGLIGDGIVSGSALWYQLVAHISVWEQACGGPCPLVRDTVRVPLVPSSLWALEPLQLCLWRLSSKCLEVDVTVCVCPLLIGRGRSTGPAWVSYLLLSRVVTLLVRFVGSHCPRWTGTLSSWMSAVSSS